MISLKEITQDIENGLNGFTSGQPEEYDTLYFKLFSDTGRFRRAKKKVNAVTDPVNGVVSLVSSQTTPNADGSLIAMLTCRVELVARLKDEEEDVMQAANVKDDNGETVVKEQLVEEGNATYVQHIRNAISSFTQSQGFKNVQDSDGQTYTVSVSYNFAETGTRAQRDRTGDSMTFVFYAYYNVIQNGQNSRSYVFRLDGQIIPYQQCTVSRTNISDADVYSGDASAKVTSSGSVFSVTLAVPVFKSVLNLAIVNEFILGGVFVDAKPNVAHILEVFYGAGVENKPLKKSFIVTISEASNTMQGVLNVGGQITLSEIVDDFEIVTFAHVLSKREFKAGTYTFITNLPQSLLTYVEDEEGYKFIETRETQEGDYSTTQTFTKDTIVVGWNYTWR
nr:MAG TPA: hypothetical protein [Caudoviricetes sp.]